MSKEITLENLEKMSKAVEEMSPEALRTLFNACNVSEEQAKSCAYIEKLVLEGD